MEKKVGVIAALLIVLVALASMAVLLFTGGGYNEETGEFQQTLYKKITEKEDSETLPENFGGGGGSGGSSGGGGGSSVINGPTCVNRDATFSLKNFQDTVVCNTYQNASCVDLDVNCTVDVQNLEEGEVDYVLEFSLREKPSNTVLQTILVANSVDALSSKQFLAEFSIVDSQGVIEQMDCKVEMIGTPFVQLCS